MAKTQHFTQRTVIGTTSNFAIHINTVFPLAISPAMPPTSATQGAPWLRRCHTCSAAWRCCGGFWWRRSPRGVRWTQPRAADTPQPLSSLRAPRWVPLTAIVRHDLFGWFIHCSIVTLFPHRRAGSTAANPRVPAPPHWPVWRSSHGLTGGSVEQEEEQEKE